MLALFPLKLFSAEAVHQVREGAGRVDVQPLLRFRGWTQLQGKTSMIGSIDQEALLNKSRHQSATQRQRMMPGTSKADAPSIAEGSTPEQHIKAALLLDNPFEADAHLELDLTFALEGMARLGPDAGCFRSQVMSTMRTIKRWLEPLEKQALAAMPSDVIGERSRLSWASS